MQICTNLHVNSHQYENLEENFIYASSPLRLLTSITNFEFHIVANIPSRAGNYSNSKLYSLS